MVPSVGSVVHSLFQASHDWQCARHAQHWRRVQQADAQSECSLDPSMVFFLHRFLSFPVVSCAPAQPGKAFFVAARMMMSTSCTAISAVFRRLSACAWDMAKRVAVSARRELATFQLFQRDRKSVV